MFEGVTRLRARRDSSGRLPSSSRRPLARQRAHRGAAVLLLIGLLSGGKGRCAPPCSHGRWGVGCPTANSSAAAANARASAARKRGESPAGAASCARLNGRPWASARPSRTRASRVTSVPPASGGRRDEARAAAAPGRRPAGRGHARGRAAEPPKRRGRRQALHRLAPAIGAASPLSEAWAVDGAARGRSVGGPALRPAVATTRRRRPGRPANLGKAKDFLRPGAAPGVLLRTPGRKSGRQDLNLRPPGPQRQLCGSAESKAQRSWSLTIPELR
jgi:hypothetical protein